MTILQHLFFHQKSGYGNRKFSYLFAVIATIIIFSSSGCAIFSSYFEQLKMENARKQFVEGMQHINNKDFERSLKSLKASIALIPDVSSVHFYLGYTYEELGNIEEAITEYRKAIEYDPNRKAPYVSIADIYTKQGNIDEAIDLYITSLSFFQENQKNEKMLMMLKIGNVLYKQERVKEALPYYEKALVLNKYAVLPLYRIGMAYEFLKKKEKMFEFYKKAEDLFYTVNIREQIKRGYFEKIYISLGEVYQEKGLLLKAVEQFKKALFFNKKRTKVKSALKKVEERIQQSAALAEKAKEAIKGKQYEEAFSKLQEALSINQENVIAKFHTGTILLETEKLQKAIAVFEEILTMNAWEKSLDKKDFLGAFYSSSGKAYFKQDKLDKALSKYVKAYDVKKNKKYLEIIKSIYDRKWELELASADIND